MHVSLAFGTLLQTRFETNVRARCDNGELTDLSISAASPKQSASDHTRECSDHGEASHVSHALTWEGGDPMEGSYATARQSWNDSERSGDKNCYPYNEYSWDDQSCEEQQHDVLNDGAVNLPQFEMDPNWGGTPVKVSCVNSWMDWGASKNDAHYKHMKPPQWEEGLRLDISLTEEGPVTSLMVRHHCLLGAGAFGKVDHVERLEPSGSWQKFALKAIKPHTNHRGEEDVDGSFWRERNASQWIREKHGDADLSALPLLGASSWGIREKFGYLFYPLAKHGSLEDLLCRLPNGLGAVLTLRVGKQLLEALAPFHGDGWAHRDIKPGNILIMELEETEDQLGVQNLTVSLADFGLAACGRDLKNNYGTPGYAAPEVLSNDGTVYGPECDLFSVAVVMYELFTGKRPFRDPSLTNKLQRKATERAANLKGFNAAHFDNSRFNKSEVKTELVSLISELGHLDPKLRVGIAAALDDIECLLIHLSDKKGAVEYCQKDSNDPSIELRAPPPTPATSSEDRYNALGPRF